MRAMSGNPVVERRRWMGCAAPVVLIVVSVALTLAARGEGPFAGERGLTMWMHRNTPGPVDALGGLLNPLVTDLTAPLVFGVIGLLVWWRWGRYAATVLGLAGAFTALTRIGDLVERPRPTATGAWTDYHYGNGGYPSGHVVFTVLVLGTVVVLARRHSSPLVARRLAVVTVILSALTTWTRISSLAHWPLDVVWPWHPPPSAGWPTSSRDWIHSAPATRGCASSSACLPSQRWKPAPAGRWPTLP